MSRFSIIGRSLLLFLALSACPLFAQDAEVGFFSWWGGQSITYGGNHTYFVDAVNGNDSWHGYRRSDSAWKTISKVNGFSFAAGDTILFMGGQTWREQLQPSASGSNGSPILFSSYGSGSATISGADLLTGWTPYTTSQNFTTDGNIVSYWYLEEAANNRLDGKGTNNLTAVGSPLPSRSVDAKQGTYSLNLVRANNNGLTDTAANQTSLNITGSLTLACWVKFSTITNSGDLICKTGANGQRGYRLVFAGGDNPFQFIINTDGTDATQKFTSTATHPSVGVWYHVVGVNDQTAHTLQIYVNGLADGSATAFTGTMNTTTVNFTVGHESRGIDQIDGLMDEVAVFNRALSAAEVATLYSGGLAGASPVNTYQHASVTTNPQVVVLNGARIEPGSSAGSLANHTFYWAANVLYMRDNNGHPDTIHSAVEASVRSYCAVAVNHPYLTFKNLVFQYSNYNGLEPQQTSTGFSVINCTVKSNGNDGIGGGRGSTGITVQNCYVSDNGFAFAGSSDPGDGVSWHGNSTGTISGCTIVGNRKAGIDCTDSASVTATGNYLSGNYRNVTISTNNGNGGGTHNFYYNVIVMSATDDHAAFYFDNQNTVTINMFNNTVYGLGSLQGISIAAGTASIKNNIFAGFATGMLSTGGTLNYDYNCLYNNTTNYSGFTQQYNDVLANPAFINAPTNFGLNTGSPCINTGVDVGLATDYLGNAISGAYPDIGALEYASPGTRYFVDATGGNNNNTGLSTAQAWKTFVKVNASTFSPDDAILLKAGETWLTTLTIPNSGAASHPIVFASYGIGAKPLIHGHDTLTDGIVVGSGSLGQGKNYITIDGIKVTNVLRWGVDGQNTDHMTVKNCTVTLVDPGTAQNDPVGVMLCTQTTNGCVSHDSINNIYGNKGSVDTTAGAGIYVGNSFTDAYCNPTGNLIQSNVISNCASGITVKYGGYNNVIEKNTLYRISKYGIVSVGFDTTAASLGNIIRYNTVYNISGSGNIAIEAYTKSKIYYNVVYGNINGEGIFINSASTAAENSMKSGDSCQVYNNVIDTVQMAIHLNGGATVCNGNSIKNNTTIDCDYSIRVDGATDTARNVFDYNCYYDSRDGAARFLPTSGGQTFTQWKALSGNCDPHSVGDPANVLVINKTTRNFALQTTSPCKNAGTVVGLLLDILGNVVPYPATLVDIGAYEFQGP
jgi:parallel beta-helix repeat protein